MRGGGPACHLFRWSRLGKNGGLEIPSDVFSGACLTCEIKIIPPAWLCFVTIGDKCAKYFQKYSSSSTNGTYYLLSSNIRISVGTLDTFKPVFLFFFFPPKNTISWCWTEWYSPHEPNLEYLSQRFPQLPLNSGMWSLRPHTWSTLSALLTGNVQ